MTDHRARLILTLQRAYSGEQAAAYAYRGHWASVKDPEEASRIRQIEAEEWHHRNLNGELLRTLGARPIAALEVRTWIVGRVLGLLCHVSGWFCPMYGAGRLESRNVMEYVEAAQYARGCGRTDMIECLLTMAEVEWEHEHYFRLKIENHPITQLIGLWPAPRRESIRAQQE